MTVTNLFRNATDAQTFTAGQMIFEEGQPGAVMYVVTSGEVDIRLQDRVIDTIGAGEILGEMALIDDRHRSATAIARTDGSLVPIDEKRFSFLIQQTPYFALYVMRVMAERLRHLHTQL